MTSAIEQLEADNAALRQAVEARQQSGGLDLPDSLSDYTLTPAQPAEEATFDEPVPIKVQDADKLEAAWAAVAQRHREMHERLREPEKAEPVERRTVPIEPMAETQLRPGSREFLAVLDELRELHLAKTLDYGIDEDALANIRSSADVVNMPPWAGCVLRISDKMHRLKAFFRRGKTEFDGVEDTLKDIACYAAIALVLYRESTCTKVQ